MSLRLQDLLGFLRGASSQAHLVPGSPLPIKTQPHPSLHARSPLLAPAPASSSKSWFFFPLWCLISSVPIRSPPLLSVGMPAEQKISQIKIFSSSHLSYLLTASLPKQTFLSLHVDAIVQHDGGALERINLQWAFSLLLFKMYNT